MCAHIMSLKKSIPLDKRIVSALDVSSEEEAKRWVDRLEGHSRAKRALDIGCDGVISSGLEAPKLRKNLGENFLIAVQPGLLPPVFQV